MKQNNKFIFYLIGLVILLGIIFIVAKEITPQTTHIESEVSLQK